MVLHHLGDSTLDDIKDVEKECKAAGAKTVVVAGDISKPDTAKDVSRLLGFGLCRGERALVGAVGYVSWISLFLLRMPRLSTSPSIQIQPGNHPVSDGFQLTPRSSLQPSPPFPA